MKTGALVLGIIGGIFALLLGLFAWMTGGIFNAIEDGAGSSARVVSVVIPIIAFVGAGMVKAKPMPGAALMAVAAVGILLTLGFNFLSFLPVILLGLGALFGILAMKEDAKATVGLKPGELR